jgi:peptide-methionine (S)-S-oxide reductase
VIRTQVGYAGGTSKSPTYSNLGDHSESIQIVYDPEQISYAELLAVFWDSHNPVRPSYSQQYKSAIFFHDDEQEQLARESIEGRVAERKTRLYTEIVPAGTFYPAEDYHQKYRLRHSNELMIEFRAIYPVEADFVSSTAAARVNGYLGGHGSLEQLESEREKLGLSSAAADNLFELVRQRSGQ